VADTPAPAIPDVLRSQRAAIPDRDHMIANHPSPLLSLAAAWDAHAADLRGRGANLLVRAASLRAGEVPAPDSPAARVGAANPETLENAARRNIVSATVLEQCGRDLRSHIQLVTRDGLDRLLSAIEAVAGTDELVAVAEAEGRER
jgi:hypothetical protein